MSDRAFSIAFAVSLGLHLVLLLGQLLSLHWLNLSSSRTPIEVIYEHEAASRELERLQEHLARATQETIAVPSPPTVSEHAQVRIPDRPSLSDDRSLAAVATGRPLTDDRALSEFVAATPPSVVDLTNLVDASRGNPVLLSYFSAIRDQIQQAANRTTWLSGASSEGLVYISFTLSASGAIQKVTVVSERSVAAQPLQEAAIRIVRAAAPFPPFPPSMAEPNKTVVVPLEFLLGQ